MKFRVIFLKKKYIYFIAFTLILFILIAVLLLSRHYSPTFTNISEDKMLKADFDGDGKEDILSVRKNNDKYSVDVKIKNKIFPITTYKNSSTLCNYSSYWPMRITLMDVSRDKLPEIFIQTSNKDNPLQYVFVWNYEKFDNVLSNSNNILGFIDCKNNKTPKVISGKFQDNTISLSNYMFLNYKFKNYNYENNTTFMGADTICTFIQFVQGLPGTENFKPKDIFSSNLSNRELQSISKLSSENNTYIFQDSIFKENKCNQDGDVSEVYWTLNFRGISNLDKKTIKNYTINLLLTPDENSKDNYHFKISSLF
ncbi:VCBS repeat-containing protein [Clostridium sp. P21]|uniref:VCBS repeat-containing protein n=1 Tax=Clostridium muellerianum TaxID=2716538 RepID=A0A7Y0HQ00_9CLOT|nr:VCBS repeat-containing protein [Clostridium muellerianum]NMM63213.1 VCBS repeat-containing protein [Clostridium muellerianum]